MTAKYCLHVKHRFTRRRKTLGKTKSFRSCPSLTLTDFAGRRCFAPFRGIVVLAATFVRAVRLFAGGFFGFLPAAIFFSMTTTQTPRSLTTITEMTRFPRPYFTTPKSRLPSTRLFRRVSYTNVAC